MSDSDANALTDRFIEALGQLEADGDPGALVELYADDGVAGNVLDPEAGRGAEGTRQFWQHYRESFDDVRSTFRNRVVNGNAAALEWQSEGTIRGSAVQYSGVTVLELANGAITRSCAYFNPTALAPAV